jgi:hypothetical protein
LPRAEFEAQITENVELEDILQDHNWNLSQFADRAIELVMSHHLRWFPVQARFHQFHAHSFGRKLQLAIRTTLLCAHQCATAIAEQAEAATATAATASAAATTTVDAVVTVVGSIGLVVDSTVAAAVDTVAGSGGDDGVVEHDAPVFARATAADPVISEIVGGCTRGDALQIVDGAEEKGVLVQTGDSTRTETSCRGKQLPYLPVEIWHVVFDSLRVDHFQTLYW